MINTTQLLGRNNEKNLMSFLKLLGRPNLCGNRNKIAIGIMFSLSLLSGDGLLVLSNLGSAPWTVLSQGIALKHNLVLAGHHL